MTNQPISQSQKRFQDSLASLFKPEEAFPGDFIFLKSSTDIGVQRNGGRNGARLAPQSFLSYFKKLNIRPELRDKSFQEIEVSNENAERADFNLAQKSEAQLISQKIHQADSSFICHLGGGHDHIYPLLTALGLKYEKIIVINIDAHADTRTDADFHSGTPFRQFAQEYSGAFHLYQVGLHPFANSSSTLSPLGKIPMKVLWRNEVQEAEKLRAFFQEIKQHMDAKTVVVFSLDADALNGAEMPGVSAVNGDGLTRTELNQIWKLYRELPSTHKPIIGIYELNPVYDTLSMHSMRMLGTFLYESI
jgi:formiminoglutamase